MMTDFRALCAELTAWAEKTSAHYFQPPDVLLRARAALADGPAVPQGREPAAVITEPSDEEWDALVERVWDKYQTVGYQGERFMYDGDFGSALDLVRKELSRWGHQPAPPADGEVAELVRTLTGIAHWRRRGRPGEGDPSPFDIRQADRLDRAAELLQRQTLPEVDE
jgi:hypothetical protein